MEGSARAHCCYCFVSFLKGGENIMLQGSIWKEQPCDVFQTKSN